MADPTVSSNGLSKKSASRKFIKYRDRLLPILPCFLNDCLDGEWASIEEQLCRVLSSGDLLCELPKILGVIQSYIMYHGLRMPKAQRVALLKLTLSMACCPNLDPVVWFRAISLAKLLMQRLWTLPVGCMELDWRRFHEMLQWLTMTVEAHLNLVHCSRREMDSFLTVIKLAKKFFPTSCVEEIWLNFRHQILERMLNGSGQHTFDVLRLLIPFYPKSFEFISRTWLPDVIDLWYILADYGKPFHDVVSILGHVARYCRGKIDWEPHLERLFCGLLRAITLPNGPVSMADAHGSQVKPSMLDPYAELLANAIGPDLPGQSSTVIERLSDFYKTMEPFYHPSNPGLSATLLISFTYQFVYCLSHRLRDELVPSLELVKDLGHPPIEYNLTVEQVDRVVNLILPVVLDHMLFCKAERILIKVVKTIDALARLRPAIVLPALLNRLEQGMDLPESPLRYTRPLYALCFCVGSLSYVRFPLFRCGYRPRSNADENSGVEEETEEAEEADEELDENRDTAPLYDKSVDAINGSLENGLNGDSVTSISGHKITNQPDLLQVSPLVLPTGQAHLRAFTFPMGRTEIVRLMNILLSGFDLNHTDRVYLTVACLSRLFLSTPMQDYAELPLDQIITSLDGNAQSLAHSIAPSTADLEETAVLVFERTLDCFLSLSDRSAVGQNVSSAGPSAQTSASDGSLLQRPHAGPEGRPRVASEVCQLSGLAGLSVALAISCAPVPHLRRRLIRLLVDATFASQWEPDTARLLAYQLYWLAVKSKCSLASSTVADNLEETITVCDTDIFALDCLWSRFVVLYQELHSDGSIVYRGRAEPRLLALLYVLAGPLAAINPSTFVQPEFHRRYLDPLFDILSELLFLSCGVRVTSSDRSSTLIVTDTNSGTDSTCACPALAEAASSLLAILLHRLTSYSIDLSTVDLMQTGSRHTPPDNLFLTSSWWTPFISIRSLFEQSAPCSVKENTFMDSSHQVACFWAAPSDDTRALADHLVRQFFGPLLERLEWIHGQLSPNRSRSHHQFIGFAPELTLADQRNQLSSLLIWANHMLIGLTDALSPRDPDGNKSDVPPPWHGHPDLVPQPVTDTHSSVKLQPKLNLSYFSCSLPDCKGQLTNLRDLIFDLGLRLLQTIADLFVRADDSLAHSIADINEITPKDDCNDVKARPTHCPDSSHSVGLLFNCSQLDDLLRLTQYAAFNRAMSEYPPCLLLPVQGPLALSGADLGARSCLAPQGNSNSHDLVPSLKLIPSLASLDGIPCCPANSLGLPTELERSAYGTDVGRSPLAWIATVQKRHWYLLVQQLRYPLNRNAAAHNPDWLWSRSIAPSPALRRLIHVMGVLATAPRRADIRRCATNHLVAFPLVVVPQVSTELTLSVIDRLENAEVDVEAEASLKSGPVSLDSDHSNAMFKLVQHRRKSAIGLLSQIFHKIDTMRLHDELLRLDPTVMARMWTAMIKQAMHKTSHGTNGLSRLSPTEIRYRQTAQDQLEHLVFDAFGRMVRLPFSGVLHYPAKMDQLVDGCWLQHVYQQANCLLKVFQRDPSTMCSFSTDPPISRVIAKRRAVYKKFLEDAYKCCLSTYQNHVAESTQESHISGVAGQALVARLLGLLPRPVDPPLTPSWKPNVIQLAPPPPAPPLALLTIVCKLITSQQPEVAHAACSYLTDTLYLLLLRHRTVPLIEVDPVTCVKQRTGAQPPANGPPFPSPRPDNAFLMFDEHARILASDEAFRQHHHISPLDVGYIYYPPKVIIDDPHHTVAYPVFDSSTGLLDETKCDWLRHLDPNDEEQNQARVCLSFLAQTLASPRDETRQFWLLLAQRLIRLHRASSRRDLFPISLFIQACTKAFGPDPLVHHIESFLRSLLLVQPGTQDKFDGITEVVGSCWLLLGTLGLTSSARQWPRPWRYYYFGRVLPRLLALLELNALTVSTSGLTQTVGNQLHPELVRLLCVPLRYAGNYGGIANRERTECASSVNDGTLKSSMPNDPQAAPAEKTDQSNVDPLTTIAKTQAGGPVNRLAFAWDLLFFWLSECGDFDVSLLHPLWEWTQEGIKDCQQELLCPSLESDRICHHNQEASAPSGCMQSIDDECPICLFQRSLALAHRRVFYARMCTTLVTYIGWKGVGLHSYLSTCFPRESTDIQNPSSWFRQAADDSVWIRDTAAKIAVYRACLPHCDVFHGRRVPLHFRPGVQAQHPPGWTDSEAQTAQCERFLFRLLSTGSDTELYGAQFVAETFLPYLVRDTIAALRLKGCEPSRVTLALRSAPPDQILSAGSSACGDLTGSNSATLSEYDKWNELTPLANRLRCLYACLPGMLAHAFPIALRPTPGQSMTDQSHVSLLQFCQTLMPLLADLCSTSNLYRTISHVLSMGTFGSAGFARTTNDGTGDEVLDGLESGASIVLRRVALIPLAGQGDPKGAVSACLDLAKPFLAHGSWKARGVGLLLLRNLVVVNLPAFWSVRGPQAGISVFLEAMNDLRDAIMAHLADQWIEVRQLAMCTLAVFIQIGLINYDSHWVAELTKQAKTPYPRKLGPEAQGTQAMADYHLAIRQRHAGILGLAAFVHAHPHTTPDYLPQIITELAGHVHDPQPIGKTVSDTLSSYSRNHQDNWHEQRHQFTEHQLESYLSVVSAAAYYV